MDIVVNPILMKHVDGAVFVDYDLKGDGISVFVYIYFGLWI